MLVNSIFLFFLVPASSSLPVIDILQGQLALVCDDLRLRVRDGDNSLYELWYDSSAVLARCVAARYTSKRDSNN